MRQSSTVSFATPGISKSGAVTTLATESTKTGITTLSKGTTASCTGSSPALTIPTATVACTGAGLPATNPACVSGKRGYDSWSNYITSGTSSILAAIPTLTFKVGTVTYTSKTSAAAAYACPKKSPTVGSELGFKISGKVTKQSTGITYINAPTMFEVCLGLVTGTGLKKATGYPQPGFAANFNQTRNLVKTAVIDKLGSNLTF